MRQDKWSLTEKVKQGTTNQMSQKSAKLISQKKPQKQATTNQTENKWTEFIRETKVRNYKAKGGKINFVKKKQGITSQSEAKQTVLPWNIAYLPQWPRLPTPSPILYLYIQLFRTVTNDQFNYRIVLKMVTDY